jgi:hypothetical protein
MTGGPIATLPSAGPPLDELVRSSHLIFVGTILERGTSTVPIVAPREDLATVRIDRALRASPVLGDLRGKTITVVTLAPESLAVGQSAVFFTNSWIHGQGIAVHEVAHWDSEEEGRVAAAIGEMPSRHLMERLQSAELVVVAEVAQVRKVQSEGYGRKAFAWLAADIEIERTLRGPHRDTAIVYFPSTNKGWSRNAPRFTEHQRGIFLLRPKSSIAASGLASLAAEGFVAVDPADFQPESRLSEVEGLVAAITTP